MKKGAWYVLALLLLVVAVAIVGIIKFSTKQAEDGGISASEASPSAEIIVPVNTPSTTPEAVETDSPIATYVPVTPVPTKTPEPTAAPTPKPTPSPTPEPTPEPTPAGTQLASGSFSSNTGTSLNLVVDYTVTEAGSGNAAVYLSINVNSWGLSANALYNSIKVDIGGNTYSLNSPSLNVTASSLTKTKLVSVTCPSVSKGSIPISVTWDFKGSYSGVDLPSITASTTVNA